MTNLSSAALLALLALSCWFDLRERRIPNGLTLAGAAVALGLRLGLGWGPAASGVAGSGFAVAVALVPFTLGLLGGGDVKLLGAVGAFLGTERLVGALLLTAVAGAVLALVEAVRRRALVHAIANTYSFAKQWVLFRGAGVTPTLESPGVMSVPYGVAIAVGTLVWWFIGGVQR
jgi:prepilin peptidase CpaA